MLFRFRVQLIHRGISFAPAEYVSCRIQYLAKIGYRVSSEVSIRLEPLQFFSDDVRLQL